MEDYVYKARAVTRKLSDAKKIESQIKSAMEWLDEHRDAERSVLEDKRKELESIWEPIITK